MATPEETAAAEKAKAEQEAADAKAAAEQAAAKEEAAKAAEDKLGDAGKAALEAERKSRREADKRAKDAEARLKALEDEKLSETEKLKKEAEEGKAQAASATDKLRRANLLTALADSGLTGAKAKAAARLLDGVEYGDDDEPTNLDTALKAAKAEYGDEVFKGVKTPAADINGGEKNDGDDKAPALTAEELAMAKSFGMTPAEYEQFKSPQPVIEPATT